jgi:hypothetical protein
MHHLRGGERQELNMARHVTHFFRRRFLTTALQAAAITVPLLVEQPKSPDKARSAIGLRVARELAGREATEAVAAELSQATPQRQALLILVLTDRGDTAALIASGKTIASDGLDVTDILRRHARDSPVIVLPGTSYNAGLGGDPAPGVPKELKIQYRLNGKPGEISLRENAMIVLPVPK